MNTNQNGFFYDIKYPNRTFAGEIEVKDGYIRLNLFAFANGLIGAGEKDIIIKGETNSGDWILFYEKSRGHTEGMISSLSHQIHFLKAMYYHEPLDEEDLLFDSFELGFARLRDFIGKTKLTAEYKTSKSNNDDKSSKPTAFSASVENIDMPFYEFEKYRTIARVSIIGSYRFHPLNNDPTERYIRISESPLIKFEYIKPQTIDGLVSEFLNLRDLLNFILQEKTYPHSLKAVTTSSKHVTIYLAHGVHDEIVKSKPASSLVTLEDLLNHKYSFTRLLYCWRKSAEKYAIFHQSYSHRIRFKDIPIAPALLSLLVGLESYVNLAHLKSIKNDINDEELKEIREFIRKLEKSSVLRDLILNDLGSYSKKKSLRSKYLFLVGTSMYNLNIEAQDIDLMVKIRNDLAHGNDNIDATFEEGRRRQVFQKILKLNNFAMLQSLKFPNELMSLVLQKL